ncbi:unnamed protein product [Oncorhynchus mykiss]|uniref:Glia maturation factor beta n=1 Tax=Oncorhynchus mykiss TaxID=8022 RepID=A0A060YFM8_ONCMY|nr:unnamed protein product [Oncorhynchus mykiss]
MYGLHMTRALLQTEIRLNFISCPGGWSQIIPQVKKPDVEFSLTFCTFVVYSYKYEHDDGRVSYPLCFIFSSPVGCKPEQQMMYAGSKNKLVQTVQLTKVFEIRNTEDLTEEWLREKLGFFG